MKGSKKYSSYEYANMQPFLPQPDPVNEKSKKDKFGVRRNIRKTKSVKGERIRSTKVSEED